MAAKDSERARIEALRRERDTAERSKEDTLAARVARWKGYVAKQARLGYPDAVLVTTDAPRYKAKGMPTKRRWVVKHQLTEHLAFPAPLRLASAPEVPTGTDYAVGTDLRVYRHLARDRELNVDLWEDSGSLLEAIRNESSVFPFPEPPS